MNKIPVYEIFNSVQGEGPNVGVRTLFIRVNYCSFHCSWCDSKYAWNRSNKTVDYTEEELANILVKECKEKEIYHVVLTGGNPCLYDFTEVIKVLHDNYIQVDVETQGDLYPSWLDLVDTIVFSPKAPSSGQKDTYEEITNYIHKKCQELNLHRVIAIKIPVFSDEDIEFSKKFGTFMNKMIAQFDFYKHYLKFYLSVGNSDVNTAESIRDRVLSDYENLINKLDQLNDPAFKNCYILPQIHTLVWGNRSGV